MVANCKKQKTQKTFIKGIYFVRRVYIIRFVVKYNVKSIEILASGEMERNESSLESVM